MQHVLTLAMVAVMMATMTVCRLCIMLAFSSTQSTLVAGACLLLPAADCCAALLLPLLLRCSAVPRSTSGPVVLLLCSACKGSLMLSTGIACSVWEGAPFACAIPCANAASSAGCSAGARGREGCPFRLPRRRAEKKALSLEPLLSCCSGTALSTGPAPPAEPSAAVAVEQLLLSLGAAAALLSGLTGNTGKLGARSDATSACTAAPLLLPPSLATASSPLLRPVPLAGAPSSSPPIPTMTTQGLRCYLMR